MGISELICPVATLLSVSFHSRHFLDDFFILIIDSLAISLHGEFMYNECEYEYELCILLSYIGESVYTREYPN